MLSRDDSGDFFDYELGGKPTMETRSVFFFKTVLCKTTQNVFRNIRFVLVKAVVLRIPICLHNRSSKQFHGFFLSLTLCGPK